MRAVLSSRMHYPPLPSRWWKKVECVGRSEEGLKPNPSLPHFNYTPFSARQANTKTERQNTITKTEHCKNCECCPVSSRLSEWVTESPDSVWKAKRQIQQQNLIWAMLIRGVPLVLLSWCPPPIIDFYTIFSIGISSLDDSTSKIIMRDIWNSDIPESFYNNWQQYFNNSKHATSITNLLTIDNLNFCCFDRKWSIHTFSACFSAFSLNQCFYI